MFGELYQKNKHLMTVKESTTAKSLPIVEEL
jgi:hypothetical protein